jgi:hypothetical protein
MTTSTVQNNCLTMTVTALYLSQKKIVWVPWMSGKYYRKRIVKVKPAVYRWKSGLLSCGCTNPGSVHWMCGPYLRKTLNCSSPEKWYWFLPVLFHLSNADLYIPGSSCFR